MAFMAEKQALMGSDEAQRLWDPHNWIPMKITLHFSVTNPFNHSIMLRDYNPIFIYRKLEIIPENLSPVNFLVVFYPPIMQTCETTTRK